MKRKWIIIGSITLLITAAAACGPIMSDVEEPAYSVSQVDEAQGLEVRDYAPIIVAETAVAGERKEAINAGFRLIADYIFGNNISKREIPMTAPVTQQAAHEEIPMTAPVIQQSSGDNLWQVQFIMPANYTMATLPQPVNAQVTLREIPERRFAVIRFSGFGTTETLEEKTAILQEYIQKQELKPSGAPPVYAFYNPPWTLPFLRRNEVMIEVQK